MSIFPHFSVETINTTHSMKNLAFHIAYLDGIGLYYSCHLTNIHFLCWCWENVLFELSKHGCSKLTFMVHLQFNLFFFLSIPKGRPKPKEELPDKVSVFSEKVPNTTNQNFGRRVQSAPARTMQRFERLTNYRTKRNKELICYDWGARGWFKPFPSKQISHQNVPFWWRYNPIV